MTQRMLSKVVGVTFEGRQENLKKVNPGDPVQITPEPTNQYDPNALAVYIACRGQVLHCGYLPRDFAAMLAPKLEGEKIMAKVLEVTGGFETTWCDTASLGLLIAFEMPD